MVPRLGSPLELGVPLGGRGAGERTNAQLGAKTGALSLATMVPLFIVWFLQPLRYSITPEGLKVARLLGAMSLPSEQITTVRRPAEGELKSLPGDPRVLSADPRERRRSGVRTS